MVRSHVTQGFYGTPRQFTKEQAAALDFYEALTQDLNRYLSQLMARNIDEGFPPELIKAYKGAMRGTTKKKSTKEAT